MASVDNGCWNCAFGGKAEESEVCGRCKHKVPSSPVNNWTKVPIDIDNWCDYCKYRYCSVTEFPCNNCEHGSWENEDKPNRWESACTQPKKQECVDHPDHYKTGKYECIDVMVECFGAEAVKNFCLLNAFKYLWRCEHKQADIEKSAWYLGKLKELEGNKDG